MAAVEYATNTPFSGCHEALENISKRGEASKPVRDRMGRAARLCAIAVRRNVAAGVRTGEAVIDADRVENFSAAVEELAEVRSIECAVGAVAISQLRGREAIELLDAEEIAANPEKGALYATEAVLDVASVPSIPEAVIAYAHVVDAGIALVEDIAPDSEGAYSPAVETAREAIKALHEEANAEAVA